MGKRKEKPANNILRIGSKEFPTDKHTYIMGILNVTPDSFSDGGRYNRPDQALRRVEEMIGQGAAIVDVGGESTRPGYEIIEEAEEIARVTSVIEKIKSRFDIPVSLDTYKPRVAQAGIEAGADLINDIWGLKYSQDHQPDMAAVIARNQVSCCLMHNRKEAAYGDLLAEVWTDLEQSLAIARAAGIKDDRILLDPGIGFAKTYEHNLALLNRMGELKALGCPLLLGASRKSVIGLTLDLPASQRLEGTLVTTVFAVLAGCTFVRVHDVAENLQAVRMAEAILYGMPNRLMEASEKSEAE